VTALTIRRVAAALGVAVVIATSTAASAGAAAGTITQYPIPVETTPRGVTVGPDGKIWFVDSGNHVGGTFVGRMATSGAISSSDVVQLPSSELGYTATPGPDGNMWVEQGTHIDKVPVGVSLTSEITQFALSGGVGEYGSIIPGPDGRLWFDLNKQVGTITTAGVLEAYESKSSSSVSGLTVGADGKIWFGEATKIARMDTTGKMGAGDEFPLPAGDNFIADMTLGPDGNIWFTLGLPAAVGRITPAGTITIFPTPTTNSLPFGLAAGPDNQIWFVERNADAVGAIPMSATSGADIVEYPVGASNAGVLFITAGPDSRMWFSESNLSALGAITTNTAAASTVVTEAASSVGASGATVNGTVNPNGASVTECTFEYGTTAAYGSSTPCGSLPGAGSAAVAVSAAISGLSADTLYHFRIVAKNSFGPSTGLDRTFTTGVLPGAVRGPVGSLPGVGSPPSIGPSPGPPPPSAFPRLPAPVGCDANRLVLTDVFPQGGKTQVIGVAPATAIGKQVTIVSTWNGKPVATTKVLPDLSFKATAALPPRSLRFTNGARYFVKLGSVRSGELKLTRRMYSTSITAAGRTITFSGNVTRPFAKRLEPVTIRAAASCTALTKGAIVAKATLTPGGTFSATFQLPASLQNATRLYLQARTRVRQNEHSSKTYPTSTLIRGIKLTA
jgi:virginiamycin B lyase